jgi:hypothetical protein
MDPEVLQKTKSVSKDNRPLESFWQLELYRVMRQILPTNADDISESETVCQ